MTRSESKQTDGKNGKEASKQEMSSDKKKKHDGTDISARVPECLVPLVILDKKLSSYFAMCAGKESVLAVLRPHMKLLELSCHGVPWLVGCLVLLFVFQGNTAQEILINTLIALLGDIVMVGLLKAIFRRGRPTDNHADMFATMSVDNYSFPSGHTSRAVMLFLLFTYKCQISLLMCWSLAIWSTIVSVSRVLLGRHHVGDILGGVLLGVLEYRLMDQLWLSPETAQSFIWLFFDYDTSEPV